MAPQSPVANPNKEAQTGVNDRSALHASTDLQPDATAIAAGSLRKESTASRGDSQAAFLDVVVVDDDEAVRLSIVMMLQHFGCRVTALHSAEALLRAASTLQPHQVILLDQNMPAVSGTMALQQLRATGISNVVCFLTGSLDTTAIQNVLATDPACHALEKPLSLNTIRSVLLELANRSVDGSRSPAHSMTPASSTMTPASFMAPVHSIPTCLRSPGA